MTTRSFLLLVVSIMIISIQVNASIPETVQIDSGPVTGIEEYGVTAFKGIPFAAPPVGDLRWKKPQSPIPWTEPRLCDQFGTVCPQIIEPTFDLIGDAPVSEDCLFLNVWSPAETQEDLLPVMVWVHGSGFEMGSGSQEQYDGTVLALEGVVVVTFNYRLNVFGFMVHPDLRQESTPMVAGNYGFLDQIAALEWVQNNIAQFGGDPNCVTVFGESAGGSSVSLLLSSPLAEGLFQRAIVQSGTVIGNLVEAPDSCGLWTQAVENGLEVQKRLGFEQTTNPIDSMRQVSTDDLLSAIEGMHFGPVMDGWCYPTTPRNLWTESSIVNRVPLLLGTTSDEGALWFYDEEETFIEYLYWLDLLFGENAEAIFESYPATGDGDAIVAHERLLTHFMFGEPDRYLARAFTSAGLPVYNYYFSFLPPNWDKCLHGFDVEYVFGTVWEEAGFGDADREFSAIIRKYWVNFATTGDPNGEGLPEWPRYELGTELQLYLGNESIEAGPRLFHEEYDLLEQYYPRLVEDFPEIDPTPCLLWELY